ncbi:Permease of the drug/metabolite transporter (DMT) superfamily [Cupriavidus oxalaticus]|jgi:drug/metabolite transporter (DMT)-like permease|uniref:Permease of the drug/metabolite transporter (DMT) superfamily n=1 Tax=Cupriavidus oxalaticus TaxID=96344 RepID=A0A976GB83_9BURK|nr:Permease of the drug/metabolite transporter (DMT) superfamily [Cupriavidus oxalaticus]
MTRGKPGPLPMRLRLFEYNRRVASRGRAGPVYTGPTARFPRIPVPASQKSLAAPAALPSPQRAGLAIAAVGAVLFSAKAIVAKLLYRYNVDAVMVLTLRMLFAVPLFMAIGWWQSRRLAPLSWADRGRVVFLGFIGYYLSSFLDFIGLQYITAGLERLILFLTPSFVLLATALVFRRPISSRQWLSLLLAYAGIVLVFAHDLDVSGSQVWLGGALVLGSAMTYAVYLILSGELVQRIGSLRLVAYAMCVSTACCVIQYVALGRPVAELAQPAPVMWLSLVNAVFCTVLPVSMTMVAVARIGAPLASQAGMIGPVSTLLLGFWLLGEPVSGVQLAGSALVLGGMYLLSAKKT